MGRPFDVTETLNMLTGSLNFLTNYRRDTFPSILTNRYLAPRTFHKADKDKFRNKTPWNCASIDTQVRLSKACFTASEVVDNRSWLYMGNDIARACLDNFFVDDSPIVPLANTDPLFKPWHFQRLVVTRGSVQAEGSQTEADSFNFGNFDTVVTFTAGVGVIPSGSLTSRVFRVYPTSSNLLYQNVNSPLVGADSSYSIEYYVSNFNLEGQNFRIYANNSFVATSETEGTIKLATSYTGNAKVVWANYTNTSITPPTTSRSGQGLLETYPITFNCSRLSGYHLNSTFSGLYNLYDLFNTYKNLTYESEWADYATAIKYTTIAALDIDNVSYIYKKENYPNTLTNPGLILTANNNRNLSGLLTVTRDSVSGHINELKAVATASVTNIKLENLVNAIQFSDNTQLSIQAASSVETVLDVILSQALNSTDDTKNYRVQVLLPATSATVTRTFDRKNFLKFNPSKLIWKSIDNQITPSTTGTGVVAVSRIQTVINDWYPVVNQIVFNKSVITDTAIAVLSGATFNNTSPIIVYSATGASKVKVKDTGNNFFSFSLPNTFGNWTILQIDLSSLSGLIELSLESTQIGANTVQIFFVGDNPTTMPSTIVYESTIVDNSPGVHTLWLGDCRAIENSLETLPYSPGIAPNSKEFFKTGTTFTRPKWYGDVPILSQSPYHLQLIGYNTASQNALQLLSDAFDNYTSSRGANGLMMPLYRPAFWNYANFATDEGLKINGSDYYYAKNYFPDNSDDPEFDDFTLVAKTVENVSKYLQLNPGDDISNKIVTNFLIFIQKYYIDNESNQPPTSVLNPISEFHNPANAALIGKIALYANLSGIDSSLTTNAMESCFDYVSSQYVGSGDSISSMVGSWSKNQNTFSASSVTYREYTSDYHAECIDFLANLLKYGNFIKYPYVSSSDVFPSITPDYIDNIQLPGYKNAVNKFTDNEQTILFSNTGTGLEMTFKYSLIDATKLETLVNFWKIQGGKAGSFTLPTEIWKHPNVLKNSLNINNLKFSFADTLNFDIRVADKTRGLWRLECKLVQTIRKVYDKTRKFSIPPYFSGGTSKYPDDSVLFNVGITYDLVNATTGALVDVSTPVIQVRGGIKSIALLHGVSEGVVVTGTKLDGSPQVSSAGFGFPFNNGNTSKNLRNVRIERVV